MRDWNEDDIEDDEFFGPEQNNVAELENKIKEEDRQRDMLEEIQDDTLAFLKSEIDKNQEDHDGDYNPNKQGGLYYGPGSSKGYRNDKSSYYNQREHHRGGYRGNDGYRGGGGYRGNRGGYRGGYNNNYRSDRGGYDRYERR